MWGLGGVSVCGVELVGISIRVVMSRFGTCECSVKCQLSLP